MPLVRSDSSSSQWAIPQTFGGVQDGPEVIADQRRLRHLSSILIRNLTLNPRRDHLSSLLHSPVPTAPTSTTTRAKDDTDLALLRSQSKRTRSRAGSNASLGSFKSGTNRALPMEWRTGSGEGSSVGGSGSMLSPGGDGASIRSRTRPRRASAASIIIREESEESSAPPSPAQPTPSPLATSAPAEVSHEEHLLTFNANRKRSASRASATSSSSAATSGSTSTIRQTPHLANADNEQQGTFAPHPRTPKLPSPAPRSKGSSIPTTFHAASSEAQLARDKARRAEILRRRLVDSFITLELAPTSDGREAETTKLSGRRRAPSVAGGSVRGWLVRSGSDSIGLGLGANSSASGSGWTSPIKRPQRSRTLSSPVGFSPGSIDPPPAPPPFFVSSTATETMHPTFVVDRDGFLLPPPNVLASTRASEAYDSPLPPTPTLDEEDALPRWEGMRQSRLVVKVWTRGGEKVVEGKGKGKALPGDDGKEWRLLLEWDVEMDGLVSLGRDPTHFPPLPPNTLIFQLHGDEYFTAPLPSRRHQRPRSHSHRPTRAPLGSLSDGDAEEEDESECCSSDEEDEGGNLSDPGAGQVAFLARGRRRRDEREVEVRLRGEAEEARRRRVLVEKSVRETRMVRAAEGSSVLRLCEAEREVEVVRREIEEGKRRVGTALKGEGEGEGGPLEMLIREREELRDRCEDLDGVGESMREEMEDARQVLEQRRQALKSRRGRLEAAKALENQRRDELVVLRSEIDEDESVCLTIRQASQERRTQLITLLSHIFPVDPYTPTYATSSTTPSPLLFSILSLPLPNSTYPPSALASETLSSALGYTAQVVSTLAAYLGVPLHYPIKCLGSRSAVVDLISMMRGPRAFPLYPKGVDRYRFDYAVFLLNKNIEQLMYSQGLTVIDLRNTLPNLKSLILALSYDPSHSDFTASTLTVPPPQFNPHVSSPLAEASPASSADSDTSSTSSDGDAEEMEIRSSSPPTSDEQSGAPDAESSSSSATAPVTDDDNATRSPASTVKAVSIRSSSPVPTVTSLRSNGTANGTDSSKLPPSDSNVVSSTAPPPSRKFKSQSSSKSRAAVEKVAPALKPKLTGRETLVAEEAKEALLQGGGGGGGKGKSSGGSRLANSLWSAVGYGEG